MKKINPFYFTIIMIAISIVGYFFITSFKKGGKNVKHHVNSFNYVIGTQTVGSKYKFTDKSMLVETALEIQKMGSNLLKFSMHPRYSSENYGLPHNDQITSLTKLATLEPSMKEVLDMDFKFYHIWTYGFSQYTPEPEGKKDDTAQIKFIDGFSEKYEKALYDELYEFTSYLLKTYNGTGKIFYLGNWEGDWHLRSDYDRTKPANPKTLEGMIKWAKIRQKAIDDAKKAVTHNDIEVYHYIEVNLVKKALDEPNAQVVANSIVNVVNPDYVSYSSYDATNPYKTEEKLKKNLQKALDYLESQLSPKTGLPEGKRVWIGEYGSPSISNSDESQNLRSIWTIKAALEWGTPFILYWEMYNNEINTNGEQVGYWLINDKGKKQPIWYTHNSFYKESKAFVEKYVKANGKSPSFNEFKKKALQFKSLNP
ncbi:hypothetical protein [Polaribacter gangjinensis]|uniref:Glycoside hydrolase family 5 domain-containing protein n=1 Tax=Polaribacter gangjinensis TaxID=574710 RepID=A0A2S7WDQ0_9FLAO|nr:hypothetical protein [Polaribacter gangjinensis]PQJ75744.1 hypothetical protein BTO13_11145 [Polaribacter gangjinensis]